MKREAEVVKVINTKTGKIRWFAAHLANNPQYMSQVGFMLAEIEEIKPLPQIAPEIIIEEKVEEIVDEFLQEESKPKRGRKPNKTNN
jgi:hypothetical protein